MEPTPRPATRFVLLALVATACGLWWHWAQPLKAKPMDAAINEFSGQRALAYSRKYAVEPHAHGSAANARVRDFLVRELKAMGLEVEIQRDPVNHVNSVSFVENVLAKLPGSANTKTIGITAHYDSVAWGPGAADDGAGVVVMLEAARALMCSPQLKHDLVFIFTGDEEGGGNGSVVSLQHPWLKDLNLMVGLEGRGDWGTPYMFETSRGNLPLMEELKKIDCPTVGNSLMYEVHHRTPNTTDFTHMADHGAMGYNVAFVGGLGYYHTANDKPEHLSPDTLQHQGEYVMSILRYYGEDKGPKIERGTEDAVYFNTFGHHLVVYPQHIERRLAAMALAVFIIALMVGFATRRLSMLGILSGLGIILASIAAVCVIAFPLWKLSYKIFYVYIMYNAWYYHVAFALLGLAVILAFFTWRRGKIAGEDIFTAVLCVWLIGLCLLGTNLLPNFARYLVEHGSADSPTLKSLAKMTTHTPAATYIATWPLFFGSLGLIIASLLRRFGFGRATAAYVLSAGALPAIMFIVPGTHALYHMGGAISPVPNALMVMLLIFSLSPALLLFFHNGAKRSAITLAMLALLVFICGWATQRYTAEKPKMNSLTYAMNLDNNKALWMTSDKESDDWLAQFIPKDVTEETPVEEVIPGNGLHCRNHPAPMARLEAAEVTVVSDKTENGKRELVLKYTSHRSPEDAFVAVLPPTHVLAASVDSMGEVLADTTNWGLGISYLPYTGETTLHLTLDAATPAPVQFRVIENNFVLPELTTLGFRPRPDWMISKPNTLDWFESNHMDSNHTIVTKTFNF